MFVTTKLAAEIKTYDAATAAIDESLTTTGLDQLDLMIIHSPQPWSEFGSDDRSLDGNQLQNQPADRAHVVAAEIVAHRFRQIAQVEADAARAGLPWAAN